MSSVFELRHAIASDLPFINAFNYAEGMDALDSPEGITVAADSDGDPVGFIRIAIGESGNAFVNPIVVNPSWRGSGVGRALMNAASAKHGVLRLVSRGSSRGFYEALGFMPCDWAEIDEGVSEDCANCSWRDDCAPVPMKGQLNLL